MSTTANNGPSCCYWVREDGREFITDPSSAVVNLARLTAYAEYGGDIHDKHVHHTLPLLKIDAPRFLDAVSPEDHGRLHSGDPDSVEVEGIPQLRVDSDS